MIKEIKHQRNARKFEMFLRRLKIVYFNDEKTLYSYNNSSTTFMFVACDEKKFIINYLAIIRTQVDCDLEKDFIFKLIDEKYNTNNYELIIDD